MITEVVELEPTFGGRIEMNRMLGFAFAALLLPATRELLSIQHQPGCLRPLQEGHCFTGSDHPVYCEITRPAVCNSFFCRVLPRLIRSYCFMASSSDTFGCLDNCSLNRSLRCRWKSFRYVSFIRSFHSPSPAYHAC